MPAKRYIVYPQGGGALPSSGVNPVGVNYSCSGDGYLSQENFPLFKNVFRAGRFLNTTTVNSSGWPTENFGYILWEGNTLPSWTSGTFACGFSGSGSETVTALDSCTVSNVVQSGGNTTFNISSVTGTFGFNVGNVTQAITSIFAYMPEYNSNSGIDNPMSSSAFTTEAIALYSQFAHIRWKDMMNVGNNTGQNTSSTRRTYLNTQCNIGWGNYSPQEGYPADWLASFCSACNIGGWFNLPVWQDGAGGGPGTYTTSLFEMLASVLVPNGKKIYIEIGNELVWNDYPCTPVLETNAVAAGFPNTDNGYFQYLGYMLHEVAVIGRSVFGSLWGNQVNLVFATQQSASGVATFAYNCLNYIASTYYSGVAIDVGQDISYGSTAPYINLADNAGDTSVAAVLSDLQTVANGSVWTHDNEHMAIYCMHYGLKALVSYEGQWQVNSEASGNSYIVPTLTNTGLTPVIQSHWQNVLSAGFVAFSHMEAGVSNGAGLGNGYYPGDEFSANYAAFVNGFSKPSTASPTLAAIQALTTGYTPSRNLVASHGTTISGSNFADIVNGTPAYDGSNALTNVLSNFTTDLPLGAYYCAVLFSCTNPGTYSLVVNASASATTNIEVNGSIVYTGTTLSSGNNSVGNITLQSGFNYIMFGNGTRYSCTINSITLN